MRLFLETIENILTCCASHSLSFAVKLLKPALSIISFRHIFWIARFKMFRFVNYAALRG